MILCPMFLLFFSRILKEKHIKGIHCLLYSNNSVETRSKPHNKAASSCLQKRVSQPLVPEELTLFSVLVLSLRACSYKRFT